MERQEEDENELESRALASVYDEIANYINMDTAKKMHRLFKGQQVTFPIRFYAPDSVAEIVKEEFNNGKTVKELSRKYGYTERRIRQIVKGE